MFLLGVLAGGGACRKRAPAGQAVGIMPDAVAAPETPRAPENVRRQIDETLKKEHQRTLEPIVE